MNRPRDPLVPVAGLLALWLGIELLHSSRWLEIGSILASSSPAASTGDLRPLRTLLPARSRVWFAPYTTYPETGSVESRVRRGVYDTFLAFPPAGVTTNYGAYKLSAADSAFAQASTGGLPQEVSLAQKLGYQWLAVDLGAIDDPKRLLGLCAATAGCRRASDGYALFQLDGPSPLRPVDLATHRRRDPALPQRSAAQRWGSLVFEPGRWWASTATAADAQVAGRLVWSRPAWDAALYRFAPEAVPPALRPVVAPPQERIWLRLAPGLRGADLCLGPRGKGWSRAGQPPCRKVELRRNRPRVEVSHLLPPGQVTVIRTEWLFGAEGLPISAEMLTQSGEEMPGPSAFAVELETSSRAATTRATTSDQSPMVR